MIRNPALKELVASEKRFIKSMNEFVHYHIEPILNSGNARQANIQLLTEYAERVVALTTSFERLGLEEIQDDAELLTKIQSNDFAVHVNIIYELARNMDRMNTAQRNIRYTANEEAQLFNAYTIMPVQRLPRYPMILIEANKQNTKEIKKQNEIIENQGEVSGKDEAEDLKLNCESLIEALDASVNLMKTYSQELNRLRAIDDGFNSAVFDIHNTINKSMTDETRKRSAFRMLLTKDTPRKFSDIVENNAYIQTMLSIVFPNDFMELNDSIYIKIDNKVQYEPIDLNDITSLQRLEHTKPDMYNIIVAMNYVEDCDDNIKLNAIEKCFELLTSNNFARSAKTQITRSLLDKAQAIDADSEIANTLKTEVADLESPLSTRAFNSIRSFSGSFFGSDRSRSSSPSSSTDLSNESNLTSNESMDSEDENPEEVQPRGITRGGK